MIEGDDILRRAYMPRVGSLLMSFYLVNDRYIPMRHPLRPRSVHHFP